MSGSSTRRPAAAQPAPGPQPRPDAESSEHHAHRLAIVALTLAAAWMYGTLRHPATWWAVAINGWALFVFELGKSEWIQRLLTALIHI